MELVTLKQKRRLYELQLQRSALCASILAADSIRHRHKLRQVQEEIHKITGEKYAWQK